jgi:hypothetical protein
MTWKPFVQGLHGMSHSKYSLWKIHGGRWEGLEMVITCRKSHRVCKCMEGLILEKSVTWLEHTHLQAFEALRKLCSDSASRCQQNLVYLSCETKSREASPVWHLFWADRRRPRAQRNLSPSVAGLWLAQTRQEWASFTFLLLSVLFIQASSLGCNLKPRPQADTTGRCVRRVPQCWGLWNQADLVRKWDPGQRQGLHSWRCSNILKLVPAICSWLSPPVLLQPFPIMVCDGGQVAIFPKPQCFHL